MRQRENSFMNLFRSTRIKTPTILQMEATECGAASLAMILAHYGRYESLEKLRAECGVNRNGSKASLILKAAREYNLEAKGYRALMEDLDELEGPLIIFWEFNHFLVYEGHSRDGKNFYLNDPAVGPRVVDRELFEKSYTGVALEFKKTETFTTNAKPMGVFSAMTEMLSGMKGLMGMIIWGGLLLVLPGMAIPALMQTFVDSVLVDKSNWLIKIIFFFILAVVLQIILSSLVQLALRRGELKISVNKTLEMLNYLLQLPMAFFSQRGNADIQNRINLNTSVASTVFGTLADNVIKFFTAIFFLILMLSFSVKLSFLAILFMLIDMGFLYLIMNKRQIINQSLLAIKTKMLNSVLTGINCLEGLKATGREDSIFVKWMDDLAEYNRKNLEFEVFTTYFNIVPSCISALGNVLILCLGAYIVMDGELTLGGLFAFQTLTASFIAPFTALLLSGAKLQTMKADLDRINDVYKYAQDSVFSKSIQSCDEDMIQSYAKLEMNNISFTYGIGEEAVLKNFNLTLPPGKRVAIVGPSGSGKSTVAKLISGVLKPSDGELLLNDKPYSAYTEAQFYAQVSIVDQSITLFAGSVEDNLTLFAAGFEARDIFNSIKDAQIEEELVKRGSILNQRVSEGGKNFSGGQRQRLEIARVLAYNTPLLILDEATSALDPVTEQAIDLALRRRGITTVIVAHRLSTIRDADEIIVLNKGEIVERGTHSELMAKDCYYASMMKLEGAKS